MKLTKKRIDLIIQLSALLALTGLVSIFIALVKGGKIPYVTDENNYRKVYSFVNEDDNTDLN